MDDSLLVASKALINQALTEDLGDHGDITTLAIANDARQATAQIIAKAPGVISGLDIAVQVFKAVDEKTNCLKHCKDGDKVEKGDEILQIKGKANALLSAERTALNFLGRMSGIATFTRQFVDLVAGTNAKILDTRKTTPGWRVLEKYAVTCGGARNHRIGLYDMFLIKENHISHAGSIANAVNACRKYMQDHSLPVQIEVETRNIDEFQQALQQKVDRIMLDNMSVEMIRACVGLNNAGIPLEVSGNINQKTVRERAETGIDYISIGALTHSAVNLDLSMLIE